MTRAPRNPDNRPAPRFRGFDIPRISEIIPTLANDTRAPASRGTGAPLYEDWTRNALDLRARALKLKNHADMTRSELIAALRR